jgi:hypothetical protein
MTAAFMLALSSAFVRWLRLSRVRALKLPLYFRQQAALGTKNAISFVREWNRSYYKQQGPFGSLFVIDRINVNVGFSPVFERRGNWAIKIPLASLAYKRDELFHSFDSASARARRQGTGVLGLLREAPNTKLEMAA